MKVPTGGIRLCREPASAFTSVKGSRSGAMPEPTVTVRMEEGKQEASAVKGGVRPACSPKGTVEKWLNP